jgi:ABC-2 type transport system permease protein
MNVFWQEIKANAKSLIIWSVCMVLLVASGMGKYTAYSAGGKGSEVIKSLPESVRALLGINNFDVTVMAGFFAMLFLYIELTLAIHAVLLGSGIIAKEEGDKTIEFLLVKPLSRASVITAKLCAALVNIVIINAITFVASDFFTKQFNDGESITSELLTFFVSLLLVQLLFVTLGTFFAATLNNPKSSGSLAVGVLLLSFFIGKITDLTSDLDVLNVLSPFKYFDYALMVQGDPLNMLIVALTFAASVLLTVGTYVFYCKRDMNV